MKLLAPAERNHTAAGSSGARVRHCVVAFDISLGESAPPAVSSGDFHDFCAEHGDKIARSLMLACNERALATQATSQALTQASQRWKRLRGHRNPVGWVFAAGLDHVHKTKDDRSPPSFNRATGGYVRGLELGQAIDALPLYQRAALVTAYHADWTDEFTAAGFEAPVGTIATRRTRAVSFIGHHLRLNDDEVVPLVREHLRTRDQDQEWSGFDAAVIERRGLRRTLRNRAAALLLAAVVITVGGALFRADPPEATVTGPEPVDGPQISPNWFDPVSSDDGAFVALNTSGSSKFVRSSDGIEWFSAAEWNSRAVDLRTEVTGFTRSGGRYLAVIESVSGLRSFVAPRIATSNNLSDWTVRQLDIEAPSTIEGLWRSYGVVATAASDSLVLVAVDPRDQFDYRAFDLSAREVCAEQVQSDQLRYFLCDDETVIDVSLGEDTARMTRYFLAADDRAFREVSLPADTAARSLIGFGGGFAVLDADQGHVWVSPNGIDWERATTSQVPNRFALLAGDPAGALVVEPGEAGWRSRIIASTGLGASGDIPLTIAPSGVWSQPSLASGPAGWALFVTTSRPWERTGSVSGWVVTTPLWIVSQLPDANMVSVQSVADGSILRLALDGPWASVAADGTVVLLDPEDGTDLVQITPQQIDQARPAALDDAQVKAQVFFSPDGVSWTSVWSSAEDAWSGSVAVGDDEILLSGTRLTGGPITIAIDQ